MVYKAVAGPHSKQWTIKKSRLYKQAHFKLKNKQEKDSDTSVLYITAESV